MALNLTNLTSGAAFSMFPSVDAVELAQGYGWTMTCLEAVNTTLNCEPALFRMASDFDDYYWTVDNVTTLCTLPCLLQTSAWYDNVEIACEGEVYPVSGKLVPVDLVPGEFNEGINMVCLKPDHLFLDYAPTNGNDTMSSNQSMALGSSILSNEVLGANETDSLPGVLDPEMAQWCFIVSQNLVGVEAEPDCLRNPDNIFCTDPESMTRLVNLYPNSILCAPCYLIVLWFRLNSNFLPNTDHTEWLIKQYLDILDICQVTMPELVIRAVPEYAPAPLSPASNLTSNTTTPVTNATCSDQIINLDGSGCDAQATKYNISTGDLQFASRSRNCSSPRTICAPDACILHKVDNNASCESRTVAYSTQSQNISTSLLRGWNMHILGLCDDLTIGQYVCASPPGGFYELPPPLPGSMSDGSGPVRGGQGSDSTSSSHLSMTASISKALNSTAAGQTPMPTTNLTPAVSPTTTFPFPTQSGITPDCSKYMDAKKGDYCSKFAADNGISEEQLYEWNPVLGKDGADCDTQFQASTEYCVGISLVSSGTSNDATSAAATSNAATSNAATSNVATSSVATPSSTSSASPPMQSGISPKCNKFDVAKKGDYCSKFATDHGISAGDLYTWNPILGENGKDCDTLFQAGVLYCISVSS
ncbi:LysM domain-containing protein [Zymoseptoria brevis]|uniref:LysM domain-containing protein n=1 Tax=Zymoseptoria brevis TaxID=1047168 RepID=A0A0F4GS29_9PEZI|nr:LysM domain-containing protein [Zymoseptoria brevis]